MKIEILGTGCAISKASSSLMTDFLKGKNVNDSRVIFEEFHKMVLGEFNPDTQEHHLGKLKLFKGVQEFPSRIKCASISWHTMVGALEKNADVTTE